MKIYKGSCHCQFIRFEVTTNIDHVRRCNCSVCLKRGALNFRVDKSALRLLTSIDDLSLYQWGSQSAEDYFCPKCGILTFRKPSRLTQAELDNGTKPFAGWTINARCLHDLDLKTLTIININGQAI
ncbi:MAG: GFA family protein [Saccharospirillaceae bacterium]|nr:GFA family protein [Pseudomonadales bacterium]NRB77054.1 GFA family protein [Saccharospirillaceae bacterium]